MADICELHTYDPIFTWCNRKAADALRNLLSYEYEVWEKKQFGKKRKMYKRYLIEGRNYGNYYFLSGFVDRCIDYLHKNGIEYQYTTDIPELRFNGPHLETIQFREYQLNLINVAIERGYGVILSPTGSGKSIILYGVISCFPVENILILVHSLDLVKQLHDGLQELGFTGTGIYSRGKPMHRITVCTVQSYAKVADKWKTHWDVVIVDEGHHIGNPYKGWYYDALTYTKCPWRFAFTATLSDRAEARFALEGLIGPVIGELTMAEGQDLGFLATPEIIFRVVPVPEEVRNIRRDTAYSKIYTEGIVNNWTRNAKMAFEAEREVKNSGTVLILVSRIAHIAKIIEFMDMPVEIVQGSVSKEQRSIIKEELKNGDISCVITTIAWVEGVDIPSLSMVINAAGGISERETLQKIGRGLRKTENKNTVKIIEFMDIANIPRNILKPARDAHILHRQSVIRWEIYEGQGWKPILVQEDKHYVKEPIRKLLNDKENQNRL